MNENFKILKDKDLAKRIICLVENFDQDKVELIITNYCLLDRERIKALNKSRDDLFDSCENMTNTLADARLSQRLTEGKLTKASRRIFELERILRKVKNNK